MGGLKFSPFLGGGGKGVKINRKGTKILVQNFFYRKSCFYSRDYFQGRKKESLEHVSYPLQLPVQRSVQRVNLSISTAPTCLVADSTRFTLFRIPPTRKDKIFLDHVIYFHPRVHLVGNFIPYTEAHFVLV